MREFQSMVSKMLKKQRERNRYLAFLVALSMIVTMIVPLGMMKPAISAVNGDIQPVLGEETPRGVLGEGDGWEGQSSGYAPSGVPSGAVDLTSYLTSAEYLLNGVYVSNATVDGGDNTEVGSNFKLDYSFNDGRIGTNAGKYVYYQLPEGVSIPIDVYGQNAVAIDNTDNYNRWRITNGYSSEDDDSNVSGYYTINKETGLVIIKFTDTYLRYIDSNSGAFEGSINFFGTALREKNEDGDLELEFGGASQPINVTFNDKSAELDKTSQLLSENYEKPRVKWTVTLTNPLGWFDYSNSQISDSFIANAIDGTVNIEPSGAGTVDKANSKVDLNKTSDKLITITYETYVEDSQIVTQADGTAVAVNVAKFEDRSKVLPDKITECGQPLPNDNSASISKKAVPSYMIDGTAGDSGYIRWEMVVTRGNGKSLKDYTISDTMWGDASAFKMVSVEPDGAVSSISEGKAVVSQDVSKIVITYDTKKQSDWNSVFDHQNSATVTPPDKEQPDDTETVTAHYDDTKLAGLDKSGSFDSDENAVVWTVTAYTSNGNKKPLSEYTLTDPQFAKAENGSLAVTYAEADGSQISSSAVQLTQSGDTVAVSGADGLNKVIFTYKVKLTQAEINELAGMSEASKRYTNPVELKDPDNPEGKVTKTGEADVPKLHNSVSKSAVGEKNVTEYGYDGKNDKPAEEKKTITWKVSIDSYSQFSTNPYTDTISASGSGADHYLAAEFGSDFTINAYNEKGGSAVPLVKGTDYTVTYTKSGDKITGFTINFNASADNYKYVDLTYDTVADVVDVPYSTDTENNTAEFRNEGGLGTGEKGGDSWYFRRERLPAIKLDTHKYWADHDASHRPSDGVTVTLYRRKGESGSWENVDSRTLTADNYYCDWDVLPKYTDDGTLTKYYYKVEEKAVDGYTASYTAADGTNDDAHLDVTNTYDKICLTVNKQWGSGVDPYDVTLKLQRKLRNEDDSHWADVADKSVTLSADSWSKTFHDLDTGYVYRVVEDDATIANNNKHGVKAVYSNEGGLDKSGTLTVTNVADTTDIHVHKTWSGDEGLSESEKAASRGSDVTVKLLYSTDGGTDWKPVSELGDAFAASKQITSDNWDKTADWTGLPAHTADGGVYVYKAEEEPVSGYSSHWDNVGISRSGTLEIVNTYDKLIFTANKQWFGGNVSERPEQLTFVLEYRKRGSSESWRAVTDGERVLTKDSSGNYNTVGWEPQPKYDTEGNAFEYRVRELGVPLGYECIAPESVTKSGNITVQNNSNRITITVTKDWKNHDNCPDHIEFDLERRVDGSDSWEKVVTNQKIISNQYGSAQSVYIKDLLQCDAEGRRYYYRVTEKDLDGYTPIYYSNVGGEFDHDKGVSFTSNGELGILNDDTLTYNKSAIDEDGNEIQYISLQNVKKIDYTPDSNKLAEQYYIFKYRLEQSGDTILLDTLPDGYKLIVDEDHKVRAAAKYSSGEMQKVDALTDLMGNDNWRYYYETAANTVYFHVNGKAVIEYYIGIPVEDFPEMTTSGVPIRNSVKSYMPSGEEITAELKVTGDKDYIDKSYKTPGARNKSGAIAEYVLDINPEAKNLTASGSGMITVEDYFYITGYQGTTDYLDKLGTHTVSVSDGSAVIKVEKNSIESGATVKYMLKGAAGTAVKGSIGYNGGSVPINGTFDSNGQLEGTFVCGNMNAGDSFTLNITEGTAVQFAIRSVLKLSQKIDNAANTGILNADLDLPTIIDVDTNKELPKGSYTIETAPAKLTTYEHDLLAEGAKVEYDDASMWVFAKDTIVPAGARIKVTLKGEPGKKIAGYIKYPNSYSSGISLDANTFDANGNFEYEFVTETALTSSGQGIYFTSDNWRGEDYSVIKGVTVNSAEYTITEYGEDYYIKFTVPDGLHLRVTYGYLLTANENTPGNISAGSKPNSGSKIYTSNKAVIYANDRTEKSESNNNELELEYYEDQASNQSGNMPKINKVNIGNFTIDSLKAEFMIAEYTGGQWIYATKYTKNGSVYNVEFDNALTENGAVPDGAGIISLDGKTQVGLTPNRLYKLIETKAPPGYKPSPYESGKTSLEDLKDFTFYFVYSPQSTLEKPDDFDLSDASKVNGVNGEDVPNIQLISIKATKNWEDSFKPNGAASASSKIKLFWSYTKSDTILTEDLYEATAENLQLSDQAAEKFTNPKTISAVENNNTALWEGLPNGVGTKKIYYYLKETEYTIDGETFVLQPDGSYISAKDHTLGNYRPIYIGNCVNTNEQDSEYNNIPADVTIRNTQMLVVKKEWRGVNNETVDGNNIEFPEVGFALYGLDRDGRKSANPLYVGKLQKSSGWSLEIPDTVDLRNYTDFTVEEIIDDKSLTPALTNEQMRTLRQMYSISYSKNINGDVGEFRISNKNSTPKVTDLQVTKTWGDPIELKNHPPVTAVVYKTMHQWKDSSKPTDEELDKVANSWNVTLNADNGFREVIKGLDYLLTADEVSGLTPEERAAMKDEPHWWYYVIEDRSSLTGDYAEYETEYDYEGDKDGVYVNIINRQPKYITIQKAWKDTPESYKPEIIEVDLYKVTMYNTYNGGVNADLVGTNMSGKVLYDDIIAGNYQNTNGIYPRDVAALGTVKLKKSDGYKYVLTNVQLGDNDFIYVAEHESVMFDVSYANNGVNSSDTPTVTITNTLKTIDLSVKKVWSDNDVVDHTGDNIVIKITQTKGNAPDNNEPLTMYVDETTLYIKPGQTKTIDVFNSEDFTVVSADSSSATAAADGDKVSITGVADNTRTTVTVTDKATGVKRVIPVVVSSEPLPILSLYSSEITAGENTAMTVMMSDGSEAGTYEIEVTEGAAAGLEIDQEAGKISGIKAGDYKLRVKVGSKYSDEVTLKVVLPDDFTVESELSISPNGTAAITPEPPYGDFTYTVIGDSSGISVDANGVVTAGGTEGASATVRVTRNDGKSHDVNVVVRDMCVTYTLNKGESVPLDAGNEIEKITATPNGGSYYDLKVYEQKQYNQEDKMYASVQYTQTGWGNPPTFEWKISYSTGTANYSMSDNVLTAEFSSPFKVPENYYLNCSNTDASSVVYKVYYKKPVSGNNALTNNSKSQMSFNRRLLAAEPKNAGQTVSYNPNATFETDGYMIVEFNTSQGDSFTKVLENLPAIGKNGESYYYQAEEIVGKTGYTATYSYSDYITAKSIDAKEAYYSEKYSQSESPEITITNTKQENSGVTLPQTGGTGTAPYTAAGAVLCSTAAVMYVAKRRRRKQS